MERQAQVQGTVTANMRVASRSFIIFLPWFTARGHMIEVCAYFWDRKCGDHMNTGGDTEDRLAKMHSGHAKHNHIGMHVLLTDVLLTE
jgi:hypothetical protein